MDRPLKIGDLLRCPHCRRWHPLVKGHTEGTAYTLRMLYFDCSRQAVLRGIRPANHDPDSDRRERGGAGLS
jgi:hypothetical protein